MYRRTNSQYSQSSSTKSRCDKNFLKSDRTIDINAIKDYNIKFANKSEIYNNFIKYKKTQKQYKSTGIIMIRDCSQLKSNSSNSTKKECNELKLKENKLLTDYMQSLSTGIKEKIKRKIIKTLKKPKDKRINRFACYVKLLIDISNSIDCRGSNSLSISSIINNFSSKYIRADKSINKQNGAKHYLEYLISNKTIIPNDLKDYKMWYKNDEEFIKALESVIKDYANCK